MTNRPLLMIIREAGDTFIYMAAEVRRAIFASEKRTMHEGNKRQWIE
ncbi:hypothetical protein T230_13335 [Tannerella sp. oral taxon BU063 isolate Cell 1/3]|uniref:Uncharacterized protein n=3 Tax=Tannerella serpentiformis TaxID=712710 RepID=W2CGS1_9BACT|nr:hypothetical protein T230_13335 [Tannerella sp. oral taxon BU063 isolate Cell 1/3]ETK11975.1 hypothetical protein T235_12610 [Tannerella sp. oral taxon BU063 isolate Cell 8/11]